MSLETKTARGEAAEWNCFDFILDQARTRMVSTRWIEVPGAEYQPQDRVGSPLNRSPRRELDAPFSVPGVQDPGPSWLLLDQPRFLQKD
jgi:hypothetical protein